MKRVVFVVHPRALSSSLFKKVKSTIADSDVSASFLVSEKQGHSSELTRAALESGANVVVAVGGDGTVHEVANAFLQVQESRRELAKFSVLPCGAGNDFARAFGKKHTAEAYVQAFCSDKEEKKIDVGVVESFENGAAKKTYFLCSVSFGFSALIAQKVQLGSRKLPSSLTYLFATLGNLLSWKNVDLVARENEHAVPLKGLFNGVVANTKYYGSGMVAAPHADPCDGKLDFVTMQVSKLEVVTQFPKTYQGNFQLIKGVRECQVNEVHLRAEVPLLLQADGEIVGTTDARIFVAPQLLSFCYPGF